MARTLSVVVLAAAVASMLEVYAQEDAFYIADGRRISLPAAQRSSAVRIVEGRLDEFQAAVEKEPAVTLVPLPLLQQRYGIAFLGAAEGVEDEVFRRAVAVLEEHPAVESAVPVYRSGDVELVLVNEFTVRFEPDVPLETGRELLERLGADVLEIDERRSRFTVTFPREEPDAALRYINELAVDPRTRYAQPSLVRVLPPRIGFLGARRQRSLRRKRLPARFRVVRPRRRTRSGPDRRMTRFSPGNGRCDTLLRAGSAAHREQTSARLPDGRFPKARLT